MPSVVGSVGGGGDFDIKDLPGVILALRWNLGVLKNASGDPAEDGDSVYTWEDQSGGTSDANQATLEYQGIFSDNGYIDFIGGTRKGMYIETPVLTNNCTIICESSVNCPGSFAYNMAVDGAAAPILFRNTGNVDLYYSGGSSKSGFWASSVSFDNTIHSMILKRTSNTSLASWDGSAFGADAVVTEPDWSASIIQSIAALAVGTALPQASAQNRWRGLVVSNQNLSDEDILNAKTWLNS